MPALVTNSKLFQDLAIVYSLPVAFGQGTRTKFIEKFNLSFFGEESLGPQFLVGGPGAPKKN